MYEENLLILNKKLKFGRIYRKGQFNLFIVDFLKPMFLSIQSNESGNFWLLQSRHRLGN